MRTLRPGRLDRTGRRGLEPPAWSAGSVATPDAVVGVPPGATAGMLRRWGACVAVALRRSLGSVWRTALAAMPLALVAGAALPGPAVHGAGAALELAGTRGLWSLPELAPGKRASLPGVYQVTVVSEGEWEVIAAARLVEGGSGREPRSRVSLGVSRHGGAAGSGAPGGAARSLAGQTHWTALAPGEAQLISRGDRTGPEGETILFDLEIDVSWDDPPGTPYFVELTTTVSAVERAVEAYVDPATVGAGDSGPISFWFRPGAPTAAAAQTGEENAGEHSSGDAGRSLMGLVALEVRDEDGELIARVVREGEDDGAATGGWRRIVWSSMPEGGLAAGVYRFRIVDGDGRLLGAGVFGVAAEPAAREVPALARAGAGGASPAGSVAKQSLDDPAVTAFPTIRSVVSGSPGRPGEPGGWSVTLVNAGSLSLFEAQLEVCLSRGWSFYGASAPYVTAPAGGDTGACRTYLLGTLPGKSRKKLDLSLVYWDSGGGGTPLPGPGDVMSSAGEHGYLELKVTGRAQPGGTRAKIHEARVPLAVADDPLLAAAVPLSGRVYVDMNGSGRYEAGEPLVAGARVIVDGRQVATTNRRGEYRAELPGIAGLIWVQSDRGHSVPRRLSGTAMWAAAGIVDVGLAPDGATAQDESPRRAKSLAGFALLAAGVETDALAFGGGRARLGVQAEATGPGVEARVEVRQSASAGAGLVDVVAFALDPLAGDRGEAGVQRDASLSVALRQQGVGLALDHASGLARDVKLGLLRPSKPVDHATRVRLELALEPGARGPGASGAPVPPLAAPGGPLPLPGRTPNRWEVSAERGQAQGDVWSCMVEAANVAHVTAASRLAVGMSGAAHWRLEPSGPKAERVTELVAEADGWWTLDGARIPYRASVTRGEERTLSPSCGLSPFDGWRWQAVVAPPLAIPLQGIQWSGMAWPGETPTQGAGASGQKGIAGWNRADELGFSFRPFALRGQRINLSAALQWQSSPGPGAASGNGRARLGGRLETRIGGMHDLRLEVGALPIAKVDNPAHLARGDGRLAVSWRVVRGAWRPWASLEVYAPWGEAQNAREFGFSLSRTVQLPWLGESVDASLRLSRAVDPDDVKDAMRLDIRVAGVAGRLEWNGTAAPPPASGELEANGSSGGSLFGPDVYKKVDWKLTVGRTPANGQREMSLALVGAREGGTVELSGTALVGGRWEADRREGAPPGWAGRWQAGVGRSIAQRSGAVENFVTGVWRVALTRGTWTVGGFASHKAGVHDPELRHAAYQLTVEKDMGTGWSAVAAYDRRLTLASEEATHWRVGVQKRIGKGGEVSLGISLVWDVSDPSSSPGPRLQASLAAPLIW